MPLRKPELAGREANAPQRDEPTLHGVFDGKKTDQKRSRSPSSRKGPQARGSRRRRLPVALIGLYAWGVSVAPAALRAEAPLGATVSALVAVAALLGALLVRRNFWSLVWGVDVFFGACGVCWWSLGQADLAERPGLLGVLGWLAYTLAWGALSKPVLNKEREVARVPGAVLEPRVRPSRTALFVVLPLLLLTPLLLAAPAGVERDAAAVLGQVVVLILLVLLVRSGAAWGAQLQTSEPKTPVSARLRRSALPVLGLLLFIGVGLIWRILP